MKKIFILAISAIIASTAFISCDKFSSKKNINDSDDSDDDTTEVTTKQSESVVTTPYDDSIAAKIATFLGDQMALEANDTTKDDKLDVEQFMRGFNEAFKENASYAQGKDMGARMAQQLTVFEQQFKIKIDRVKFLAAFSKAINDKNVDEEKMQALGTELQQIMMKAQTSSPASSEYDMEEPEEEEYIEP